MTQIQQCITAFSFIDSQLPHSPSLSLAPPPPLFSLHRFGNMGNLLKVLTCTDLEQEPNFFLDFESEFLF